MKGVHPEMVLAQSDTASAGADTGGRDAVGAAGGLCTAAAQGQAGVLAAQVLTALQGRIYAGRCERHIQDRIGAALEAAGLVFERECRLSERDRPDFLVGGQVVVEVKLKTPRSVVLRQLGRYAEHDRVKAIVVASTSFSTLHNMSLTIHGVPVHPVALRGLGLLA